jgi:hypothetical protein
VYRYFWKLGKALKFGFLDRSLHENVSALDKHVRLQTMLDEFTSRKAEGEFYGGERPDATDFRCYALVRKVRHTFMMK